METRRWYSANCNYGVFSDWWITFSIVISVTRDFGASALFKSFATFLANQTTCNKKVPRGISWLKGESQRTTQLQFCREMRPFWRQNALVRGSSYPRLFLFIHLHLIINWWRDRCGSQLIVIREFWMISKVWDMTKICREWRISFLISKRQKTYEENFRMFNSRCCYSVLKHWRKSRMIHAIYFRLP